MIWASLVAFAPIAGVVAQPRTDLSDFDRRRQKIPVSAAVSREKGLEYGQLKARLARVRVDWDSLLKTPKYIRTPDGFLTGTDKVQPAQLATRRRLDPAEPVRRFLRRHSPLFGHGAEVLEGARIRRQFENPRNGLQTVIWEQQVDGIAVFQAVLIAHVTRRGELVCLGSQFLPDPAGAADRSSLPRRAMPAAPPPVSAAEAVAQAARNIGDEIAVEEVQPVPPSGDAVTAREQFTAEALQGAAETALVWLPIGQSELRLCWEVIFTSRRRGEMFRVLVDVQSGEVWLRHCLTETLSDATYRVFTSDSPSPLSPGHSFPSSIQPPLVSRALVTLSALSSNASPAGWINEGDNETSGNNVEANLNWDGDDVTGLPRPQGSPFRVFDFPLDLEQDPRQSADAALVQLFYWCNWMHDALYELGFTEQAGNFQKINFDRGGRENDPVLAEAQDGSRLNNASFSTPPDGLPGRMQVSLWTNAVPWRDACLDADIVLHEYAHGLSNRRVGGGVGITELQSRGLGEGWSDFYALSLLAEPGDDPNATYPLGGYSSYLVRGLQENYYYGIRRYPYSTDLSKNPLTFKDIDPQIASSHDPVPRSPAAIGDADEVHRQGEVWCVALWEARANLIARWGFKTGHQLMLQLVTDGLNLTPPNPDFLEARDAILLADRVNNDGANFAELWSAFAKRGMGAGSAAPPSSTTTGVQESFELPDDLVVIGPEAPQFRGPVGGPFQPRWQTYEVRNLGTNLLAWSAGQSAPWLSVAQSGTNLAPALSSGVVEVFLNPLAEALPPGLYREVISFTNLTSGRIQGYPITVHIHPMDDFSEEFRDEPIDVDFQTLNFTPDGSTNFYSVCRTVAAQFPTDPTGGTALALSDDSFIQITLADGKEVSLFGRSTNSFYVGSNGYLSFGAGEVAYEETLERHFDRPRISGLFRDLDPQARGSVSWLQLPDRVAVTFQEVSEYSRTNRNSFQIEMFFDGALHLTWLQVEATNGIVGLSRGGGLSHDFVESDWSAYETCAPALTLRVPAAVREGDGWLAGQAELILPVATNVDLTFSLASSDPSEVLLPGRVTIPAGQTNAIFDLEVVDDGLLDLAQTVLVSAFGISHRSESAAIVVLDDETANLSVTLPSSAFEGGSIEGTVHASTAPTADTTVNLFAGDTNQIAVPRAVFIPAGQTSAIFLASVPDNGLLDGSRTATVTARVPGWTDGTADITVLDDESRTLTLRVPTEVSEGDGELAAAGTVEIAGPMPNDLLVVLFSVDDSEIIVPGSVIIPKGLTNVSFAMTVVDDPIVDGTQNATLYAFAVDFRQGSGRIAVHDNEPAILTLSAPAELTEGDPEQQALLTISAVPSNDVWVGLASSDTNQILVPPAVRIPAGQTNATFPFTVVDDVLLDGAQLVTLTARVTNWTEGISTVTVQDNESAEIDLTAPAEVSEGIGRLTGAGIIRLRGVPRTDVAVTLTVSDTNEVTVPEYVVIPAGQSNGVFDLTIIDDTRFDGPVSVTITARAQGFAEDEARLVVADNEVHHFLVGEIASPETAGVPFEVTLTAVDIADNRIAEFTNTVAWRAVAPGGELPLQPTNATFFNSGIWTGSLTISVATTNVQLVADDGQEHRGTSAAFDVVAGPLDHFEWNPIPAPQRANIPFSATLTARDAFGNTVAGFSRTVVLTTLINSIPANLGLSPVVLSNFVGGAWVGELVVREPTAGVQIRAVDKLGRIGLTSPLEVILANDLALSLVGPVGPVAISNLFSLTLAVTNSGPTDATGVIVTNVVPPGANLVSVVPSQGTFTSQEGVVVCALGSLTNGAQAIIELVLQAVSPGTITNSALLVRGEPDANHLNNVVSVLTLITNSPPSVALTHPTPQDRLFGPTNVWLVAEAEDSEGVAKVEFFEGDNKLGERSAPPYDLLWEGVLHGEYTLRAVATDSFGATNTSTPVVISVGDLATNVPPQILSVQPASGSLFNAASNGLRFSVITAGQNSIPTHLIRLTLNGAEVSGSLIVGGEPTNRTGAFFGLEPNATYSALLVVADDSGRTADTQWTFDTFDAQRTLVIEAEDYNYSDALCTNGALAVGGLFQDHPPPSGFTSDGTQVNGGGIGYLGQVGLAGVDFLVRSTNTSEPPDYAYRPCDPVGIRVAANEFLRPYHQEAGVHDYVVTRLQEGDWLNYTRTFTQRDYMVYLRASSPKEQELRLGLVQGDRATTNQIEAKLGLFALPATANPDSFAYAVLTDYGGQPVIVRLTNVQTVRLTALTADADGDLNYLVFVPVSRTIPPTITKIFPLPDSSEVAPDALLRIRIGNGDASLDTSSIVLRFDETEIEPSIEPTPDGLAISYRPPQLLEPGSVHRVSLSLRDVATPPGESTTNWTFTVANLPVLPIGFAAPGGSGGDRGFRGRIQKARNDAPPELFEPNDASNAVARAELQLSGGLIDPATGLPFVNEAAGPNGDGAFLLTGVVNFEQRGTNAGVFLGDVPFPWVAGEDPDYMAMELLAYLELTSGVYRFGINCDAGFQLSVGARPSATEMVLARSEGRQEQVDLFQPIEFEFVVPSDGLYGFRLLWWEGRGPAHLEWYARDRQTGQRLPINSAEAGALAAYQFRVVPAAISVVQPDNDSVFGAPADIEIAAVASENEEPAGTVTFFAGDAVIGIATGNPFNAVWTNVSSGSYLVTAVMTNRSGDALTSAPVRILVNAFPVISPIPDQTAVENSVIPAIPFTVSDQETPVTSLAVSAFSSNTDLLPAANILFEGTNNDRSLTLLPLTNQFGTAIVAVVVSDGITNVSTSFTLTVAAANLPPVLEPIPDLVMDEGQTLQRATVASDADVPAQSLTFSLDTGAPAGATIDAVNGVVTWTPDEAQGPGTYSLIVRVTDDGSPPRSATQQFMVTVNEVNRPPALVPPPPQRGEVGSELVVTNFATDPDLPANRLTFSLGPDAPAGVVIDPDTGTLKWMPTDDAGAGTNAITIRVVDDGSPSLSDEQILTIAVALPLRIENASITDEKVTMTWRAVPGQTYQVQYKTDLRKVIWNTAPVPITATNQHASFSDALGAAPQKFYRIVQVP